MNNKVVIIINVSILEANEENLNTIIWYIILDLHIQTTTFYNMSFYQNMRGKLYIANVSSVLKCDPCSNLTWSWLNGFDIFADVQGKIQVFKVILEILRNNETVQAREFGFWPRVTVYIQTCNDGVGVSGWKF